MSDSPQLYRFNRIEVLIIDEEHLRPSVWWVRGWRDLEPELVEISFQQ